MTPPPQPPPGEAGVPTEADRELAVKIAMRYDGKLHWTADESAKLIRAHVAASVAERESASVKSMSMGEAQLRQALAESRRRIAELEAELQKERNDSALKVPRSRHDVMCTEINDLGAQLKSLREVYAKELDALRSRLTLAEEREKGLWDALEYESLKVYMNGVLDDAEEMGSSDIPVGYEELSPEHAAIADACWRHGKKCTETAMLNRLFDYSREKLADFRRALAGVKEETRP